MSMEMSRKALDMYIKPEKMPRITRQEFIDNLDEILEQVSKEDMAFVITEAGKDNLLLCPAEWFGICWDEDFSAAIKLALRAVWRESPEEAEVVSRVIIKNIWRIDTAALQDMCGIVESAGAEDQQAAIRQLHTRLLAELQAREDEAE